MAEQLAWPDQVEHTAVVADLDSAGAHHPDVLYGPRSLLEDLRAGAVELDLGGVGHPRHVGRVQRVEGRMGSEEVGDVVHAPGRDISALTPAGARKILA